MNIVNLIKSIAEGLISPPYIFGYGTEKELNALHDDTQYPAIFLVGEIFSNDDLKQSSYVEENYQIKMLFLDKSELENTIEQQESIIQSMRALRQLFLNSLQSNPNIRFIKNIKTTNIHNLWDTNVSGVWLEFQLTPFNDAKSCV
jgi:hypothetical protein